MRRRLAWLLLLAAVACQRQQQAPLDEVYRAGYAALEKGELQAAQELAEKGRSRSRDLRKGAWEWAFQVLEAEVLASRRRTREALALLEPGLAPSGPADSVRVRALMTRGFVHCLSASAPDAFRLAEEALDQAASDAAELGSAGLQGEVELRRGSCRFVEGRWAEAEALFGQALATARQEGIRHLEANAAGSLGLVHTRTGHYDEAAEWLRRSLEVAEEIGADVSRAKTLNNLGWCYFELGDYERALAMLTRAESLTAQLGLTGDRLVALTNLGRTLYRQRSYEGAKDHYTRALSLARELDNRQTTAQLLSNLAIVALDEQRYDDAESYVRDALGIKEELDDQAGRQHSLLTRAQILAARGAREEAEALCRRVIESPYTETDLLWQAHGVLAQLHAQASRPVQAEAEFRQALRLLEESRSRLHEMGNKLPFFSNLRGIYDSFVELLLDLGRPEEALRTTSESRARLLREGEHARRDPVTADGLQQVARASQAVLLSYWTAPQRSLLWVVTPGGIEVRTLPGEAALSEDVEAYQHAILQSRDLLAERPPEGERLWRALVAPVADLIPPGSRVVVVPDGPLHQLNFETLIVPGSPPHYWIEDVTVASTPSLSLLGRRARARGGAPSILVIGDPVSPNGDFPRLTYAAQEVRRVAEPFDPASRSVYAGLDADPSCYTRARPERFTFIHFAAHVTANREIPLESAVILSPRGETYKLYARDVVAVPIQAELVTLSACHSAGARAFAGEGLVGLAWAFMNAGAKNVIGGLWDVEDASTAELMEYLYQALRDGADPARSLREAKLRLLRSQTAYRKPFYWAPFVTYLGP